VRYLGLPLYCCSSLPGLKEIIFYIVVIPVVLISFNLAFERKQIFSSKEKEDKTPKESLLAGIKYKSRDGFKAIHPLLAALIILMLAYIFHVIFFVFGELYTNYFKHFSKPF